MSNSVNLPRKVGDEVTFKAMNHTQGREWMFWLKKLSQDTWMLTAPLFSPRARFGNKGEMMRDVEKALETGNLPGQAGRP